MYPKLCGCYYFIDVQSRPYNRQQVYLPQVASESHTTILSTTSRTKLKQLFTNVTKQPIDECIYSFPLYDGVAIVGFTCHVGSRTLRGVVKEKGEAKTVYEAAKAKGETAGLLEQLPEASDVFTTKLGNIPSGETVIVEIEYIGELKQDAETTGIRFTIPTKIAPRYGSVAGNELNWSAPASGIKIVIDAQMPPGSNIQGLQSPSHPISVALGTLSTDKEAEASLSKASASLSLDATNLDKDFVLIVLAKDTANPKAILETHSAIPHQRALMVTLVPKFSLPPSRPEIVFVADRSGSMAQNIPILVSAMKVFLKSLPVGVKFNICSFGSSYEFLWPKSKSYGQDTLSQALSHVSQFQANFGGTETFAAVKATIMNRYKDIPLEVILLTDGDIWRQNEFFAYINEQVEETKGNIRVFPLGLGNGVSHALIEGIARAGNGFGQSVQDGEKLDKRVVRMLKGALSPHITDYSLEVKYEVDEDFELVEKFDKVTDGFKVTVHDFDTPEETKEKIPISLFDSTVDPDQEQKLTSSDKMGQDRYAHLPTVTLPKLLQAPHKIPPLYAFTRTTVYLLLSPDTYSETPTSVILRATSAHGPLELEIPVDVMSQPGLTIHQLAAKKAVQDLEEGRGWVYDAVNEKNTPLKELYPSRFDDMVEREAVRLGIRYGIAGKWCSFVAVRGNDEDMEDKSPKDGEWTNLGMSPENHKLFNRGWPANHTLSTGELAAVNHKQAEASHKSSSIFGLGPQVIFQQQQGLSRPRKQCASRKEVPGLTNPQHFGQPGPQSYGSVYSTFINHSDNFVDTSNFSSAVFGATGPQSATRPNYGSPAVNGQQLQYTPAASYSSLHGFGPQGQITSPVRVQQCQQVMPQCSPALFGAPSAEMRKRKLQQHVSVPDKGGPPRRSHPNRRRESGRSPPKAVDKGMEALEGGEEERKEAPGLCWAKASDEEKVHHLIELQDFEGYWKFVEEMYGFLQFFGKKELERNKNDVSWVTMLVVVYLETKMKNFEETWELVVDKARSWASEQVGEERMNQIEAQVKSMLA